VASIHRPRKEENNSAAIPYESSKTTHDLGTFLKLRTNSYLVCTSTKKTLLVKKNLLYEFH
jgi:hypothetical protein